MKITSKPGRDNRHTRAWLFGFKERIYQDTLLNQIIKVGRWRISFTFFLRESGGLCGPEAVLPQVNSWVWVLTSVSASLGKQRCRCASNSLWMGLVLSQWEGTGPSKLAHTGKIYKNNYHFPKQKKIINPPQILSGSISPLSQAVIQQGKILRCCLK